MSTQLTIKQQLLSPQMQEQIARALPQHVDRDRFVRAGLTALQRVPKLSECTMQSFFKGFLDAAQWGLEINGHHAHLIPYGREATLIIDYKGIVELAYRTGKVDKIHCDVVYEGDDFVYDLGEVKSHVKWGLRRDADKPAKRGEIIGAYAHIVLKGGICKGEFMDLVELNAIRKRSRAGSKGPWETDTAEMYKKTVFRRASKWIPLAAEVFDSLMIDHDRLPAAAPYSKPAPVQTIEAATEELMPPPVMETPKAEVKKPAKKAKAKKKEEPTGQPEEDPAAAMASKIPPEVRSEIIEALADNTSQEELDTTVKVLIDMTRRRGLECEDYINLKASEINFS